jgi:hypothetical protein
MKRILLLVLCAFLMGCTTTSDYHAVGLIVDSVLGPVLEDAYYDSWLDCAFYTNKNKPFDDKELEKRVDEITYERLRDGWRDAGYTEEEIEKMLKKYKSRQSSSCP